MTDLELPDSDQYFEWVSKMQNNGVLENILFEYYSDESENIYSVQVGDSTYQYPIGTHPQLLYPHFTVEGVTEPDDAEKVEWHDEELLEHIAKKTAWTKGEIDTFDSDQLDEYVWNDPTYAVTNTSESSDSSVSFEISESDFYTVASRNTELSQELVDAILKDHFIGSTKISQSDVLSNDLAIRDRYFSSITDRLMNSHEYPIGIGGTYITILRSEDEYYLITGNRSSDVFVWSDMYTVFPAGFFQPSNISTGIPVRDNLLYGYSQEFFDDSNPNLSTHSVKSLNQFIESGNAQFYVTGSGVELVYGNYQVTGALVIEYDDYLKFIQDHSKRSFQHDSINIVKLSELEDIIETFADPQNITPTSGFALFNGLHYLDNETDLTIPLSIEIDQFQSEHPPRLGEGSGFNFEAD